MNIEALKEALLLLQKEQPEFLADLLRETIQQRVCIASTSDGDYYNPGRTYVLQWYDPDGGYNEFSRAY